MHADKRRRRLHRRYASSLFGRRKARPGGFYQCAMRPAFRLHATLSPPNVA